MLSAMRSTEGLAIMDVASAAEAVAVLVGGGAVQGLSGQAAIDAVSAIRTRIREVFGRDHRAVAALDHTEQGEVSDPAQLAELASALRWYAERDQQFATEMAGWATLGTAQVVQTVKAQRDAYVAGRDQTVNHLNISDS
jgi:hypothetical protein